MRPTHLLSRRRLPGAPGLPVSATTIVYRDTAFTDASSEGLTVRARFDVRNDGPRPVEVDTCRYVLSVAGRRSDARRRRAQGARPAQQHQPAGAAASRRDQRRPGQGAERETGRHGPVRDRGQAARQMLGPPAHARPGASSLHGQVAPGPRPANPARLGSRSEDRLARDHGRGDRARGQPERLPHHAGLDGLRVRVGPVQSGRAAVARPRLWSEPTTRSRSRPSSR